MSSIPPLAMHHEYTLAEERRRMLERRRRFFIGMIGVAFSLIVIIVGVMGTAKASDPSWAGCSSIIVLGTTSNDLYTAGFKGQTSELGINGILCASGPDTEAEVADWQASASNPFDVMCANQQGVVGGPQAPTTLELRFYWDSVTTPFRTINVLSTCVDVGNSFTDVGDMYCTSDGTSGGSPRFGLMRIQIHVASTGGIAPYDVNSDTSNQAGTTYGIIRCVPNTTAVNVTATSPFHFYVGGDVLQSKLTLNAADGLGTTNTQFNATCGTGPDIIMGDANPTAGSATTVTTTIQGSPAVWVDDCALSLNWSMTRFSGITGYSTVPMSKFNSSQVPAGTTVSCNKRCLRWDTTDVVDRTLTTSSSCTVTVNGATSVIANRVDSVASSGCGWQDARGTRPATNQPERGWFQRSGQYRTTTDYASHDALWLSSGNTLNTISSTTTAVTTSSLGYHKMVEEFGTTARTDSVLWNWGNTSGIFDVSNAWLFDGINISKTPLGANASSFTISADTENARSKGLRDANGALLVGKSVSCQRTRPDAVVQSAVTMGNTDASGNSPEQTFSVDQPQGTWSMTCTSSGNGNSASYTIRFFHASAFTANTVVGVKWNVTGEYNGTMRVNITGILRTFDGTNVVRTYPDDAPHVTVQRYDSDTGLYSMTLVDYGQMTLTWGTASAAFTYLFWTPPINLLDTFAFVQANLTGSNYMGTEGFTLQPYGDFVVIGNITVLGNATVRDHFTNSEVEGAAHANSTWCPLPCSSGGGLSAYVNETFEGRAHANTTFEGQVHANTTFEGQVHANATWCPLPCSGGAGDPGLRYYVNETFEGQAHANMTWCPLASSCSGNFTGNFTGNFSGALDGSSTSVQSLDTEAWSAVPYVLIIVASFALALIGIRFGAGFMMFGGAVALLGVFLAFNDATASGFLRSLLGVVALACIMAGLAVKRQGRYG
jgi:hypothetical protein